MTNGAVSTFLAIVVLADAQSYIFRVRGRPVDAAERETGAAEREEWKEREGETEGEGEGEGEVGREGASGCVGGAVDAGERGTGVAEREEWKEREGETDRQRERGVMKEE